MNPFVPSPDRQHCYFRPTHRQFIWLMIFGATLGLIVSGAAWLMGGSGFWWFAFPAGVGLPFVAMMAIRGPIA